MAVDDTAPRAPRQGPIALADLFDAALKDLTPNPNPRAPAPMAVPTPAASGDAFLFSGNRHESVPRRLFVDRRLTPLERNAWQVFRLMLNDDGVTTFPTYEQLRPWLASMPCAGQASHETVARALTLLRLTRSPSAWPTRASPPPQVIHRRMRSTIPKKGPPAFFGMANALLRNPKQGRNPRQTALFGIRSRTVQYVVVVLMKYVLPRRRARWATCNGPSVSRN